MDLTNVKLKKRTQPVWKGPEVAGITQSMIAKWLFCRERARAYFIEGLRPHDKFDHKIEYGNMFHLCMEHHAARVDWKEPLWEYAEALAKKYPFNQEEIDKWFNVCICQFPIYLDYWFGTRFVEVGTRSSLLQEQVFDVPYKLPSGRTVRLRGKWDGVDLVKEGKDSYIQLQEHKTKGDIDEQAIQRQLRYDLQTQMYLIALERFNWVEKYDLMDSKSPINVFRNAPIRGVRYNVIRRPLSGGEGDIKQKKGSKNIAPETKSEFYDRLAGVINGEGLNSKGEKYSGPSHWFMRWDVTVTPGDIENFKRKSFDPILESICDWYDWLRYTRQLEGTYHNDPWQKGNKLHFMSPFGVSDRGMDEIDYYIMNGDRTGLVEVDTLFPELEEEKK